LRDRPTPAERRLCLPLVLSEAARCRACTRLADGPVRALEDVLALCRAQGIPVTLVRLPESAAYRELYGPAARVAVADLLARVRARWGVEWTDAQLWVPDEEFWDAHHLLTPGARRFSERFGREVLRPALERLAPASHARAQP
jgi:hypothetical protein